MALVSYRGFGYRRWPFGCSIAPVTGTPLAAAPGGVAAKALGWGSPLDCRSGDVPGGYRVAASRRPWRAQLPTPMAEGTRMMANHGNPAPVAAQAAIRARLTTDHPATALRSS